MSSTNRSNARKEHISDYYVTPIPDIELFLEEFDKRVYLNWSKKKIIDCCADGYKESVCVDKCIAREIEELWRQGVKTTGCCCGHGKKLGFIQVRDKDSVEKMKQLGYQHYIYEEEFGGKERLDAFIPKTTEHIYEGYSEGYVG